MVKKSLQPAANASCLSLWSELAVSATMMTGLLNISVFTSRSSSFSGSGTLSFSAGLRALLALDEKTPILLTFSIRRISRVASSPFILGSWISMRTKWKPPARHLLTASNPFMAVCHRTLSRFTKASSSRRLMGLSSTISTLIGGTAPFRSPDGKAGVCGFDSC